MATLTETAYYSRKAINLLTIGLVGFIILKILFAIFGFLVTTLFPAGPPPANFAFGKLPYPNSQNDLGSPSASLKYTLETVGNSLPLVPKTLKVYFMTRPAGSFDSYENMKSLALKAGFSQNPIAIGKSLWKFNDPDNPLRTMEIDQNTLNFKLIYNYQADQNLFNEGSLTTSDQTLPDNYLQQIVGNLPQDLVTGTQAVSYFKLDSGKLVPASSLSTADALSVSFNRAPIKEEPNISYPVVSPKPQQGLVSVLVSPSSGDKKKVLEARYYYTPVELTTWATYNTITSDQALELLKKNDAFLASLPNPQSNSITIRKAYIAYLDPFPGQNYLQPVMVFSDEKGFMAYVPLVDRTYLLR